MENNGKKKGELNVKKRLREENRIINKTYIQFCLKNSRVKEGSATHTVHTHAHTVRVRVYKHPYR